MKSKILLILILGLLIAQPSTQTSVGQVKNRDCALMVGGSFIGGVLAAMLVIYCTKNKARTEEIVEEFSKKLEQVKVRQDGKSYILQSDTVNFAEIFNQFKNKDNVNALDFIQKIPLKKD